MTTITTATTCTRSGRSATARAGATREGTMDAKLIKLLAAAALAVAVSGCSDDKAAPDTAGEVAAAWRARGLEASAFRQMDGSDFGGGECARGDVNGVEVTLCRYQTEEAATAAHPAGLKAVGAAPGPRVRSGT